MITILISAAAAILGMVVSIYSPKGHLRWLACVVFALLWGFGAFFTARDQKALEGQITGGKSFAAVIPAVLTNGTIGLIIHNEGHEILSDVTIQTLRIRDPEFSSTLLYTTPSTVVGTIAPDDVRSLDKTITPQFVNGLDAYLFFVSAQNGTVTETLQIRDGGGCSRYDVRYWVEKPVPYKNTPQEKSWNIERLLTTEWPDWSKGSSSCARIR
jgi:hypothetical protein